MLAPSRHSYPPSLFPFSPFLLLSCVRVCVGDVCVCVCVRVCLCSLSSCVGDRHTSTKATESEGAGKDAHAHKPCSGATTSPCRRSRPLFMSPQGDKLLSSPFRFLYNYSLSPLIVRYLPMWTIQHIPRCVRGGVLRLAALPTAALCTPPPVWQRGRQHHRTAAAPPRSTLVCPCRTFFRCTLRRGVASGSSSNDNYPDYFFDMRPEEKEEAVGGTTSDAATNSSLLPSLSAAAAEVAPPLAMHAPPAPEQPPSPSPTPPTTEPPAAGEWAEFQHYLRHVEASDPEFLAYAAGHTPPFLGQEEGEEGEAARAAAAAEAAHLLRGGTGEEVEVLYADSPPPPLSVEAVEALDDDWAAEDELGEQLHADSSQAATTRYRGEEEGEDEDAAEFGDDAATDAVMLAALKGRAMRLQDVADTVTPPLRIPDKNGNVPDSNTVVAVSAQTSVRLLSAHSFLSQQDRLYLHPRTPPEAQLQPPTASTESAPQCVLVVFSANDLRVHDNHLLALAAVRAKTAAAEASRNTLQQQQQPPPVVALCVLDYRTFAQPSVVGGFFRQSPQRARFLLNTVAALRQKLEGELRVPLLIRCGRPEEHVPRLAVELGATDVFVTTQYAPHERRVQALMTRRLRQGVWVSRENVAPGEGEHTTTAEEAEDPLVAVREHQAAQEHPYGGPPHRAAPPVVHSVWQTTLVHLDDLPTPLAAMKEGERWWHDDVTVSTIRPTAPYDAATQQLATLPQTWQQKSLLPSREEQEEREAVSVLRGPLPTLEDLGYASAAVSGTDFAFQEVIATQSSHPTAGEEAALTHLQTWLANGGMTSMLRYGRDRRTNVKLYSQTLARVSPYIAVGALSPRKYYEVLREHAHAHQRDGFVQQQFREALLRLSRRDYWHWMGLRFGDRLFFSYGPHPEQTDAVPDWRHDAKVVQRWCCGLTGIPFADAAMRELLGTGFVAHEGRQALAWLLTRGYGQDWRLGAEWMERCSLDYDPFVCYGNFAYSCGLLLDDFGEPVRNTHYLAHHHDQTGIYIKKWLPQLSKVPPVYIHRPHILTPRMQAMHGVYLGKTYPYPLKLWQGAQRTMSAADLPAYYPEGIKKGPGYAEALRYGACVLPPEDFSAAVSPGYVQHRAWAAALPASAFADVPVGEEGGEELLVTVPPGGGSSAAARAGHVGRAVS